MRSNIIYILIFLISLGANAQNLNDYLSEAAANNPELKGFQYKYESALEKVTEVGSVPNTSIGIGYFVQTPETRVGSQRAKLSIAQKLPWFGTLEAKKESATFKAAAQSNMFDFIKRKLFLEVKTIYFELFELKATKAILNENIEIMKTFEELALIELENSRSTMVDVLKIRMEKNELFSTLHKVEENTIAKTTAFNLLLNRAENTEVNIIENIVLEDTMIFNKASITDNPKVLQLNNLENALEKAVLAVKKEGLPMIGLKLDYVVVDKREMTNLIDNGKDIIMPMVTVSIPLFSKKYSSKQKQLRLDQKAIATNKSNTINQLNTIFSKASRGISNSKIAIKTQIENISEADRAKEVLFAAYETSKIDFEQLLEIQQLKLKFQLKKVVAEKAYSIQKSTLEFLTKNN
ncbi:MAG: TolC family protein [Flavobacteriaceae bacterium]|nr:TolC family protein [Flavobacteriaceae bacterium]